MPWDSLDRWRDEDGDGTVGAFSDPLIARAEAHGINLENSYRGLLVEIRVKTPPRLVAPLRTINGEFDESQPDGRRRHTRKRHNQTATRIAKVIAKQQRDEAA